MWIDQPFTCAERATEADMPLPPAVPEEWLKHLEEVDAPPPKAANVDDNGKELPAAPAPRPAVQAEPMPNPAADQAPAAEPKLNRLWPLELPGMSALSGTPPRE